MEVVMGTIYVNELLGSNATPQTKSTVYVHGLFSGYQVIIPQGYW